MAGIRIAKFEDLKGLATKEEVDLKADKNHSHSEYATVDHTHSYNDLTDKPTIPDTSDLATKEELNDLQTLVAYLQAEIEALKGTSGE